MVQALGYAVKHTFSRSKPMTIGRDEPKAGEVAIDVLSSGVCHPDVHQYENDWGYTVYLACPGTRSSGA